MAIEDDDKPRKKITHEIGQDLSLLSVEELTERIALLNVGDRAAASGHDQEARVKGCGEQLFQVVRLGLAMRCSARPHAGPRRTPVTRVPLGQWPTWQTKAEKNRSFTID